MLFSLFRIRTVSVGFLSALALSIMSGASNAVTYQITNIINNSQGGFGSTVFHEADGCGGKCGDILERAVAGAPTGAPGSNYYDSITGAIAFSFNLQDGGSVSAMGDINFLGDEATGTHAVIGTIDFTFTNDVSTASLQDQTITVKYLDTDYGVPNGISNLVMALWGSSGTPNSGGDFFVAQGLLGSDLRLELTPVPVPAALPLLASALGGMGLIGWRRRCRASAAA